MKPIPEKYTARFRNLSRLQGVALEGKSAVTSAYAAALAAAMLYPSNGSLPYEENRDTGLILRGIHPDVTLVSGDKPGIISVDAVRALQREAYVKPNQAPGRVFILAGAASMTPQAQNALLKILETPPGNVRFILTAENRHNLLATIQSRLVIVPIEDENVPPPDKFPESAQKVAALLSDWQSVTELLGDKAAIAVFNDCGEAYDAIKDGSAYRLMAAFAAHEKKRDDFIAFCRCLREVCAHHLMRSEGQAKRLMNASHFLDETADRASHNVFLPMLGSYAASRIIYNGQL